MRDKVLELYFMRPASSRAGKSEAATLAKLYERRDSLVADRGKVQHGWRKLKLYSDAEAVAEMRRIEDALKAVERDIDNTRAESAHAALLHSVMAELVRGAAAVAGEVGNEVAARLAEPDDATPNKFTDDALMAWWRLPEFFGEGDEKRQAMKAALGEQFDALPLEQQRHLVRSLVSVTVNPGQGRGRVVVDPL